MSHFFISPSVSPQVIKNQFCKIYTPVDFLHSFIFFILCFFFSLNWGEMIVMVKREKTLPNFYSFSSSTQWPPTPLTFNLSWKGRDLKSQFQHTDQNIKTFALLHFAIILFLHSHYFNFKLVKAALLKYSYHLSIAGENIFILKFKF